MRSLEERVAEAKRRIAARQREKRLRRNTIAMASAVAACLVLLIGASRFGRSWAIPENAEKPSDPRFQKQHRDPGRTST